MKSPSECNDMQDIRAEIDRLDRKVIGLLSQRYQYVQAAAKFKTDEASVRASERFHAMLSQRRELAEQENLNPVVIEKIYRDLVNYFIEEEMTQWKAGIKST